MNLFKHFVPTSLFVIHLKALSFYYLEYETKNFNDRDCYQFHFELNMS